MHELASKAATEESTAGLLKIMDDIASLRAAAAPPIVDNDYRVLSVRSHRLRPTRAATIAPLPRKPMRERGFLPALFAGGLGLAVLAGPVTCATCDLAGQLNAERIAAPISTAAISPAPDRAAAEMTLGAGKLPDTIEELADKGPLGTKFAATVEGDDITGVEPEEPALRASPAREQASIEQRPARARTPATLTAASSAPKLYSPNKYRQVPSWAAKMFDTNWQGKAFAYQ
jgi:hypothetical protein